jgi:predicted transcriptional regulator
MDMPVVIAVHSMLAEGWKWLVVLDADGRPIGLLDRQLLLEAAASG